MPLQLLTHKTCQDKLSWVAFHHRPLVKMPGDRLMGDIFNSSTKYKGEDLMLSLLMMPIYVLRQTSSHCWWYISLSTDNPQKLTLADDSLNQSVSFNIVNISSRYSATETIRDASLQHRQPLSIKLWWLVDRCCLTSSEQY